MGRKYRQRATHFVQSHIGVICKQSGKLIHQSLVTRDVTCKKCQKAMTKGIQLKLGV